MTDQEINEQVARKLGWAEYPDFHPVMWKVPESNTFLPEVPDYCGSIQAAWEIAIRTPRDYVIAIFDESHGYGISQKQWYCELKNMKAQVVSSAEADTAPMAICLAFLKLH